MGAYGRATLFDIRRSRRRKRQERMGSWAPRAGETCHAHGRGADGGGSGRRWATGRLGGARRSVEATDVMAVLVVYLLVAKNRLAQLCWAISTTDILIRRFSALRGTLMECIGASDQRWSRQACQR